MPDCFQNRSLPGPTRHHQLLPTRTHRRRTVQARWGAAHKRQFGNPPVNYLGATVSSQQKSQNHPQHADSQQRQRELPVRRPGQRHEEGRRRQVRRRLSPQRPRGYQQPGPRPDRRCRQGQSPVPAGQVFI